MAQRTPGKPIRALYLQPAPLFGGAERQAALTAMLLPDFGVEVVPMVGPGSIVADWLRECGVQDIVETRHFPGGWRKQRGLSRLTLPSRYVGCGVRAREQIAALVRFRSIDIIVASLAFAWITGSLVARRARIPIVWRAGGTYLNLAQQLGLRSLTRVLSPDLLLCNSDAVQSTFSPLIPAPVAVVPNGVRRDVFYPGAGDPTRYRRSTAERIVGCAMRLADAKRPEDFIELAVRLKSRFPETRFLLAGEGSRRAELERRAHQLGVESLTFLGFVSDMPSFYAACDLLVLPSRSEGCPNYLLEAAAMGKPVVAAAIPPVVELVRKTRHAVLFELADVAGLTSAVAGLLSNPEQLAALGQRGLSHIEPFSAHASAARLAGILQAVVAEHGTRPAPSRAPGRSRARTAHHSERAAAQ